eukprot:746018-Hanusia_phi.AAC.2
MKLDPIDLEHSTSEPRQRSGVGRGGYKSNMKEGQGGGGGRRGGRESKVTMYWARSTMTGLAVK